MTDLPIGPEPEKLGVGGIVGDTFSLFFSRIGSIFMLAFLPALIVVVFEYQLTPPVDLENRPDLDPGRFSRGGKWLSGLISMIGTSLISAPVSYTHLRAHETSRAISYAVFCV